MDSSYGQAYAKLGECYYLKKNLENALLQYEALVKLCPEDYVACYRAGRLFFETGDPDRAVVYLQKAAANLPPDGEILYYQGAANKALGKIDIAIQKYFKAIELDPEKAAAHLELSSCYIKNEDYSLAELHAGRALDLDPAMIDAYLNLAIIALAKEQPKVAKDYLNKALSSGLNNSSLYTELGNVSFIMEDYNDAEKYYLKALEMDKTIFDCHSNLGYIYHKKGELDKAIPSL